MTDERERSNDNDGWVMPEPVFRSSKGYDPRKGMEDTESDIPAEKADSGPVEADTDELPAADEKQNVRPKPPAEKKSGCLSTAAFFIGIISLSIAIILAALVYFLYYYVPPDSGNF
jgi:hypothetical protein